MSTRSVCVLRLLARNNARTIMSPGQKRQS